MIDKNHINHIIHEYFSRDNILLNHQIDSFNDLIDNILPDIISNIFPIKINIKKSDIDSIEFSIKNIRLERPTYTEKNGCNKVMTPNIARLKNYTYSLQVLVDIIINNKILESSEMYEIKNVILCKIPIIVRSKYCVYKEDILSECKYDTGGYFIINGNEKVLVTQEKVIPNIIHLYPSPNNNTKYKYISEVKSLSPEAFGIVKTCSVKLSNKSLIFDSKLYIKFPRIKKDIPISVIFRALGCLSDKEILYYIIDNSNSKIDNVIIKIIHSSLLENENIYTEMDAIKYLSNYINVTNNSFSNDIKLDYTKNIIKKDLLPHLDTDIKKLHFLGLMVNKLIKYSLGLLEPSNRDSYQNKRMEVAGVLMGNLVYQGINKISKDIKLYINKNISDDILSEISLTILSLSKS